MKVEPLFPGARLINLLGERLLASVRGWGCMVQRGGYISELLIFAERRYEILRAPLSSFMHVLSSTLSFEVAFC